MVDEFHEAGQGGGSDKCLMKQDCRQQDEFKKGQ